MKLLTAQMGLTSWDAEWEREVEYVPRINFLASMETVLAMPKDVTKKTTVETVVMKRTVNARRMNLLATMETASIRSIIAMALTTVGTTAMRLVANASPLIMLLVSLACVSVRPSYVM